MSKKKYIATYGNGRLSIISVFATNVREAKKEITRQLNRPGRRGILKTWVEEGEKLRVEDD